MMRIETPTESLTEATDRLRSDSPEILVLMEGISRIFDTLVNRVEDLGLLSEEASVDLERQMESLVHSVKNAVHSKGPSTIGRTKLILSEMLESVEQFLHDKQFPSVEEMSRKLVKVSEQMKELVTYIDQNKEDDASDSGSRSGFVDDTMKIEFSKFLSGAIGSNNKNFTDSRFAEDERQQPEVSQAIHQEMVKQNTELQQKLANLEALRKNDQQVIDLQYRCLEVLQNQVRDLMKLHEEMKARELAPTSPGSSPDSSAVKQHTKSPSKANLAERFQSKLEQIGEEMDEIEETNKKIQDIQGISFDRKLRNSVEKDNAEVPNREQIETKPLDLCESRSELEEAETKIRASAPTNDIDAIFKEAMKSLGLSEENQKSGSEVRKKSASQKERLSSSSSNSMSQAESIHLKPMTAPPLNFRKGASQSKNGTGPPAPIRSVTPRQPVAPQLSPMGTSWDRDAFIATEKKTAPQNSNKFTKNTRSSSSASETQQATAPTSLTAIPSLTSLIRREVKSVKTELNLVTSVPAPKSGDRASHKSPSLYSPSQNVMPGIFSTQPNRPSSKRPSKPATSQEKQLRRSSVAKSDDIEKKGASLRGSFNLERGSAKTTSAHFAKGDYYPSGSGAAAQKKESSLSFSNNASATKPPRMPTPDARQNSPKKPILESTGGNYGMGESINRRTSLENVSAELRSLKKDSLARDMTANVKLGAKISAVATSHSSLVKGAAGVTAFSKVGCQPSTNHVLGKTRQFARSTLEQESSSQILIHKPRNSPKKGSVAKSCFVDNYGFGMRQSHQPESQVGDKNLLRYIDKLQREYENLRESSVGNRNLEAFKLQTENTHLKDAIMMLTGRDAYEFIRPSATSPPPLRDPLSYEELDSDLAFLARSERGSATLPSQRHNSGN